MSPTDRQGPILSVLVGMAGACLGEWLLGSVFGAPTMNEDRLRMSGLLVSFLGSLMLLIVARRARITQ